MNQIAADVSSRGAVRSTADRPLESLPLAVNRVNNAVVGVQQFLDRFHGPSPEKEASGGPAPLPDLMHHSAVLGRLFEALDRLETRVDALNSIG